MKILKKILAFNIILVILISFSSKDINFSSNIYTEKLVKVGVLLYSFDYLYLSSLRQDLENIQKENPNKVEFTFFDSKANTSIQLENMNKMIENDFDFLIFTIYEKREEMIDDIIFKVKEKNIPLIFFGSTIVESREFKDYPKVFSMNFEKTGGSAEGKIIVDLWNTNKEVIDKNKDNILQYILLRGFNDNQADIDRATGSIEAINKSGIKTQQLTSAFASWNRELGKSIISSLFLRYGRNIEAIISTNDDMAIGAVEALQQYGYNKGDKSKNIVVVGFDAIPEAQALIKKGFMTGSVTNKSQPAAEALYAVGMNLVSGQDPVEGTSFKINGKNIDITIPYEPYTINSVS